MADAPSKNSGRIFVVDDDDLFRESLETNLQDAGYEVSTFSDGESVIKAVAGGAQAELILLDWKMPGLNGIEVLRQLRADGSDIAVIFLTVLGDQIFEEAALSSGAVDFVEKSRSFAILLKRIELSIRAARGGDTGPEAAAPAATPGRTTLQHGPLELNLKSHRAFWNDVEVGLSLTEFKMVHLLVDRAGEDVRYRDLYDLVHGEGFVAGYGDDGYRTNVRTFVKRVRKKFRDIDGKFDAIENYPGFGYRWRAEEHADD